MGGGAEGPTIIRVTGGFGFNPTIDGEDFPGLDEDQAIAEARARHARFVTIGLEITDKGFPTQWVSDSVKRIPGYEVEEALAPDWWIDCLHPDDKKAAVEKTSILMIQGHLVQE
jgi:hypothetical protein